MAIDGRIPLAAQLPPAVDLAGAYQNAFNVRNAMQQGQLNQQRLQENEIKLGQEHDADNDRKSIRSAYDEAGGDPDETLKRLKKYKVSPGAVMDFEKSIRTARQEVQNLDDSQRKAALEKYDQIRAMLLPVDEELDDGKAAQMFANAYKIAESRGLVDEKMKAELGQIMPNGFTREGLKTIMNSLSTGSKLLSEAEKQLRAEASYLRADVAVRSLDEKMYEFDLKNETDRMKAEAYIDNIESQIGRRTDMTDLDRKRFEDSAKKWRAQLQARRDEEAGRNRRADQSNDTRLKIAREGEKGKDRRVKLNRDSVERVAAARGTSGANVQSAFLAAERAAKAANPDWDDLDEDTQDRILNSYFDAFVQNQPVAVTPTEDQDPIFPDRGRTVKPTGPPIPRQAPGAGTPAPAQKPQGNVRRKGNKRKIPRWLAEQYATQAGSPQTGAQWAIEDGWDISK